MVSEIDVQLSIVVLLAKRILSILNKSLFQANGERNVHANGHSEQGDVVGSLITTDVRHDDDSKVTVAIHDLLLPNVLKSIMVLNKLTG